MLERTVIRSGLRAFAALLAVVLLSSATNAAELVMFRRDGCPWCAKWDRAMGPIYPKTEFNRRAPLRLVNLDRGPAPTITYAPIRYTPTFVLIEDGKEIGRIEGYPGDEFFWLRLENLLERLPPPQSPKGVSAPAFGVGHAERML